MEFVDLVRDRYELSFQRPTSVEIHIKHPPPLSELQVVSLRRSLLTNAGEPGSISSVCPKIKELDISMTSITSWSEVFRICSELPSLEFLDISRLSLDSSSLTDEVSFPSLKRLEYSKCSLSPAELRILSRVFPELEELNFRNAASEFSVIFTEGFQNTIRLTLSRSGLQDFEQIVNIGHLPSLQVLLVSHNPICEISDLGDKFRALKMINLEETGIACLNSLHNLDKLPVLTEVRLGQTPLAERWGKDFRSITIAYLLKAKTVNGGSVTEKERLHSERQYLRDFSDENNTDVHASSPGSKNFYSRLEEKEIPISIQQFEFLHEKHGTVYKFAEVDLSPRTHADLKFELDDGSIHQHTVPLNWEVRDLKDFCCVTFDIQRKFLGLWYGDHEIVSVVGYQELKLNNQCLFRYKMKDEDIIIVKNRKQTGETPYVKIIV